MSEERLHSLLEAADGADELLILPHNNPDPDAIASAVALRYLLAKKRGIECDIFYKGIVGRAENRALLRYLGYPLKHLNTFDPVAEMSIALVDTQPGAGNNALPPQMPVTIVIDHHPWRETSAAANFFDVRPTVGSVATMMTEYLRTANLKLTPQLATALFYGIKTDTMGLGRGTSAGDTSAFCYLLPLIDVEALFRIERAQVPKEYFKSFAAALQSARIFNGLLISYLGTMDYPDMVAEMADFLMRMEGGLWVLCMGVYQDQFILSVRTHRQQGAGQLVQKIVGDAGLAGGHGAMAGGQIPLDNHEADQLAELFIHRARKQLGISSKTKEKPLV